MKRFIAAFVLASTALTPMLATQTASAHAPTWGIAGGQYFWYSLVEEMGHGNTVNTPAGSVDISETESPIPVGNGASVGADDANDMFVQNFDRLDHTFTHCTSACDGPTPVSGVDAIFDATLASGASAQVTTPDPVTGELPEWTPGTYQFFCKVHTWMRGSFQIT